MENNIFAVILGGSIIVLLLLLVFYVFYVIGLWKLFEKAGKEGWKAIIPFYNTFVLVEISGLNWWYFLIAISGIICSILGIAGLNYICNLASLAVNFFIFYNLAKKMKQQPIGFAVASIFVAPIITMVLGFSSKYTYDNTIVVSPNGPIGDVNSENADKEKYCLGCGVKLKSDVKFCENCGKKVD